MEAIRKEQMDQLLAEMIQSAEGISDLFFVVGKSPHVEVHGRLKSFDSEIVTPSRSQALAKIIINDNARLIQDIASRGSCDCSYSLSGLHRFRVNIYRQNGNYAMVLRRLQSQIPTVASLNLPPVFEKITEEKNGLIFVTGGTGSGKTTTLAALLNKVNVTSDVHVVTLEDPIEFLHPHLKAIFSQRELGSDFYNFPDGLRAALRQAPKIILIGEIRDRETMEIALTAGETGHLVYSTLHTISAGQTINRILGMFGKEEEQQVRERLAASLRYVISQRLVPKLSGGRLLITELMGSNLRTREVIAEGENDKRRLFEIIESAQPAGWHTFEQSLLKAYEEDLIADETALLYCTSKTQMTQRLDMAKKRRATEYAPSTLKMQPEERIIPKLPPKPPVLPNPEVETAN